MSDEFSKNLLDILCPFKPIKSTNTDTAGLHIHKHYMYLQFALLPQLLHLFWVQSQDLNITICFSQINKQLHTFNCWVALLDINNWWWPRLSSRSERRTCFFNQILQICNTWASYISTWSSALQSQFQSLSKFEASGICKQF